MAGIYPLVLVEMPPRHGKTELISKWFPVWVLEMNPNMRIMLGSYEADYAAELGSAVRDLITEHSKQLRVRISPGSSARHRWQTAIHRPDGALVNAAGGMIASGRGGSFTGRGANVLIIDDPIKNAEESDSPLIRETMWRWFESTVKTRLEPGAVIVVVATRWNQDDIIGRIKERQEKPEYKGPKWKIVSFPALADHTEGLDELGRSPGDALWPERYSKEYLEGVRDSTDDWIWYAMHQQHPTNPGGVVMKRDWFENGRNRYKPGQHRVIARFQSWDTAMKKGRDAAYTSCSTLELTDRYKVQLASVYREKLTFDELPDQITNLAQRWNQDDLLRNVVIEDKASGTSAYQTLMSNAPDWLIPKLVAFMPTGDKIHRARQAAVWCKQNGILLPEDPQSWTFDFEQEFFNFPGAKTSDQMDAFSQGVVYLEHYIAEGVRIANDPDRYNNYRTGTQEDELDPYGWL
jgi:predicted phage terminase large subunit-like protein